MSRRIFNLERDLRKTWWIVEKVQGKQIYAQNLYAALCNNQFAPKDTWAILQNIKWSCSWKQAGYIVADIRGDGDYLDWYCSGGWNATHDWGITEEGYVSTEIAEDIGKLGWLVVTNF